MQQLQTFQPLSTFRRSLRPGWVSPGSTADLQFANDRYWSGGSLRSGVSAISGWSFTRSGSRYSDTSAGALTLFGANTPRITDKGLAVDAGATNLFLNSDSPATQNITVTAQAYTLSLYGTGSITLSGASTAGPLSGTGANDRVSLTFTPSAGTLTLTVAGSVDKVQLETGSIATPYIPTAGATASAGADVAQIDLGLSGGRWTNLGNLDPANGFTVVAEWAGSTTGDGRIIDISAATLIRRSGPSTSLSFNSSGEEGSVIGAFSGGKAALADDEGASEVRGAADGSAVTVTFGTYSAVPLSQLFFGSTGSSNYLGGYIRRVTIFPTAKTTAELEALST